MESRSINFWILSCRFGTLFLVLLFMILLSACGPAKRVAYFQDIPDSVTDRGRLLKAVSFTDPVIQANDILQVNILTLDPQVNNMLNTANSSTYSVQPSSSNMPSVSPGIPGFLVDKDGNIQLPLIGKVHVGGLTTAVARDTITNRVSRYYKEPVVNIRFANFSITVLGEVNKPAIYTVPNEKVSVLDAIGMAGDMTIFGKRDNVLLVRDSLGQKHFVRFDLNSTETFKSPYFYLKQGDVLYVEPSKAKLASLDANRARTYAIIASALSVMIILITRINF